MKLSTAPLQAKPQAKPIPRQESDSFFIDLDPLSGIKDAFTSVTETVVETGFAFGIGAAPGYGANELFGAAIIGGFGGRSNSDTNVALAGAGLNAAGTLSLAVAGGQYLLGADPTVALGIAGLGLAGAGIASVIYQN